MLGAKCAKNLHGLLPWSYPSNSPRSQEPSEKPGLRSYEALMMLLAKPGFANFCLFLGLLALSYILRAFWNLFFVILLFFLPAPSNYWCFLVFF